MKQLVLSDVVAALTDKPTSIGDRLATLGLTKEEAGKKFSAEILKTEVYASSFAKFLQDNAVILSDTIPAKELPEDYKNPFEAESNTVGDRLTALGVEDKDIKDMFDKKTLDLSLNGDEFQDFIVKNQAKFLGKLESLATQGG